MSIDKIGDQFENAAINECNVTLTISGEDLVPAAINDTLRVTATRAFGKGDQYRVQDGRTLTRPRGVWHFSTQQSCTSRSLEAHSQKLLAEFESKIPELQALMQRYRVGVTFWWDAGGEGPRSFALSSDTMKRVCDLCSEVIVRVVG
jgi:hypothetical protein